MNKISIEDAIRIAADGDAILFVGAGVGFLVRGPMGPLPDGAKLSNRILRRSDDAPNPPPLDKATGFAIRKLNGVEGVYKTLIDNFTVESVDDDLAQLYKLPWRRIYTTNYDEAIETARKGITAAKSCTLEDDPSDAQIGTVVHINGQLSKVSPSSIERDLSLSDRSYATRNFERSTWYSYLSTDLDVARSVIFIGYSLYDLDISRLIFTSDISGKTFFFVSPNIDEVEEETISLYGQNPGGGVKRLFEVQKEALSDYKPVTRVSRYSNLLQIGIVETTSTKAPSDILRQQLVYGELPEPQVIAGTHVFGNKEFIVQRHQAKEAIKALDRGLYRDILITGEFASGKSATALAITAEFIRRGYKAYAANHGKNLSSELSNLASVDDRIIVVFEGYSTLKKTIIDYARRRNPKHRMILTEQAVQHDFHGEFLYEPSLAGQVFEVVLDRIADQDARDFAELLDFGGYWLKRGGASDDANASYISNQLKGSLFRLLTEIIESEDVQNRINNLLSSVLMNRRATEFFVGACIVNVLGVRFRMSDWVGAFDPQFARSVLRNYGSDLQFFMSTQSGHVFPRNGLLSSSILKHIPDREIILEACLKIFGIAAARRRPFDFYDNIFIRLMQFNRLQPIMRGSNENELIFAFYEKIRPLSGTHKISDYWLQLGIAGTALDDLEVAADAFENAYAKERKKPNPNFKKIDNYYNRFLLAYSASLADSQEAYELFSSATEGLSTQMFLEDNRHYPFKSGRMYGQIAKKHYKNWRTEQQEKFKIETNAILVKAKEYERNHRGQSIDVEVLIRELTDLIKKLS